MTEFKHGVWYKFFNNKRREADGVCMTVSAEVNINGTIYVPKNQQQNMCENYYIVRATAGVFAGEIIEQKSDEVTMKNARRLWYWDGAASLSQLAVDGVKKPKTCKFPCEVPEVKLLSVIEILKCTVEAQKSIKEVSVWEQ